MKYTIIAYKDDGSKYGQADADSPELAHKRILQFEDYYAVETGRPTKRAADAFQACQCSPSIPTNTAGVCSACNRQRR